MNAEQQVSEPHLPILYARLAAVEPLLTHSLGLLRRWP